MRQELQTTSAYREASAQTCEMEQNDSMPMCSRTECHDFKPYTPLFCFLCCLRSLVLVLESEET